MRVLLAAALSLASLTARAQDVGNEAVQIVSPRPDKVSVTIYRDLFALITETRTVDLPAGPVTLVFDGVTDTLIPQSALLSDAGRPIAESNYDFEALTPENVLRKSIGKPVMLTRMNPATGKVRQLSATVLAANPDGIVFRTDEGNEALHCSGLPEQLTLDQLPEGLKSKPALSIHLAAGAAGKRQVRISYIAQGFAWESDYVAHVNEGANAMDLLGWLTLRNLTNASFRDAEVQVVAGKLNLLGVDDRGSSLFGRTGDLASDDVLDSMRDEQLGTMLDDTDYGDDVQYLRGCYPFGMQAGITAEDIGQFPDHPIAEALQRVSGGEELYEVVVTGARRSMAVRESLADYQMYRLPARTDLAARQSKQVAFLHKDNVKIDRFYSLRLAENAGQQVTSGGIDDEDGIVAPNIKIGWMNRESDGLGEPLPAGLVRFFESRDGGAFVGDGRIKDSPVGTPIEVLIGQATDLTVSFEGTGDAAEPVLRTLLTRRVYLPCVMRIANAKPYAVSLEIRQGSMTPSPDFRVTGSNLPSSRKGGDYLWRFTVPANGEQRLTYKIGSRVEDN